MSRTASPLRYPGGKSALEGMVTSIICKNGLLGGHYAEPFAGGGGLALSLLFSGVVRNVHLNDVDPAISSLWQSLLDHTDDFVELLQGTAVTVDEWHRQREIYLSCDASNVVRLGFATLFLNRTNRSGIIKGAGMIGGLRQTGNYLLDCRFNKDDLEKRIRRISKYRHRITFTALDALDFLDGLDERLPKQTLVMADPPYYAKGSNLYTSYYEEADHSVLAKQILNLKLPWITSYDNCVPIAQLYKKRRQYEFSIQYSAQTKRLGSELMIASKGLRVPADLGLTLVSSPR